jgi:methyl-accepting chemotaxis protein
MIGLFSRSIAARIALASIIPFLGLALFAGATVIEARQRAAAADEVVAATALAEAVSLAAHELQRERGMSVGFVASKGATFAAELPNQRQQTDARVKAFREAIASGGAGVQAGGLGRRVEAAVAAIGGVEALRSRISGFSITAAEAGAAYTQTIAALIGTVDAIAELSSETAIIRATGAYAAIVRGKELAGQERAAGARGFAGGKFSAADLRAFVALGAAQEQQFDMLRRQGLAAQIEALKAALSSAASAEVTRMREASVLLATGDGKDPIAAPDWFKAATARIDELKKVEDRLAADLKAVAVAVSSNAASTLSLALAISLALISAAAGAAYAAARSITRPLGHLVADTLKLADGNTDIDIQGGERRDEVGGMARAVVIFRDNAIERARLEQAARAAQESREQRQRRVDALIGSFRTSVAETLAAVAENATQMDGTAKSLTSVATAATTQATGAAAASEQCSGNVQNVASACEELSSSIKEIGKQVESASAVVRKAAELSRNSNGEIESLAGAAQRIGDVVGLIQAIAAQTNLLALNATIEAARAGEAGRGFAVVASEVKSLATQTAKATEEISQQIGAIQHSTTRSVDAVRTITTTMTEVDGFTSAIAAAVEEQGAATAEISRNVQMAARGTQDLTGNVAGVTGAINETSHAAANVLDASGRLGRHASALRQEVDRFLTEVAAA